MNEKHVDKLINISNGVLSNQDLKEEKKKDTEKLNYHINCIKNHILIRLRSSQSAHSYPTCLKTCTGPRHTIVPTNSKCSQ